MKPATRKLIVALREADDRGLTTGELDEAVGTRFGSRLHEARGLGFVVEKERIPGRNTCRYRLTHSPVGASVASPGAGSSGDRKRTQNNAACPAPPASVPPVADAGLTLFELPEPRENPDSARWRDLDQRDVA